MGASSADVSALLDDPKSNVKSITVSPVKYQNTKVFPAGDTTLTYTARNSLNEVASCVTSVTVKGRFRGELALKFPSFITTLWPTVNFFYVCKFCNNHCFSVGLLLK
jgi:hypothetical protein